MTKQSRFHIAYWVAAILGVLALQYFYSAAEKIQSIPYSQFAQLLQDHKIAEVAVSDRYIQGKLKEPLPSGKAQFVTTRVDPPFADELQQYGVNYTGEGESTPAPITYPAAITSGCPPDAPPNSSWNVHGMGPAVAAVGIASNVISAVANGRLLMAATAQRL